MQFGYTIVYVNSVSASLAFYNQAFGFATRFLHESGQYGELETGATALAFASHAMGEMNLGGAYTKSERGAAPLGIELAFVCDDLDAAYAKALAAGAQAVMPPETKPWGQSVAYVRGHDGELIELCTPVSG